MAELRNTPQEQAAAPAAVPEASASAEQKQHGRPCPKDCRRCSMAQQICCSSMLSFQMYDVMNSIITRLDLQSQRIFDLEKQLSDIQSSETELSAPLPFQGDLFDGH